MASSFASRDRVDATPSDGAATSARSTATSLAEGDEQVHMTRRPPGYKRSRRLRARPRLADATGAVGSNGSAFTSVRSQSARRWFQNLA
jgi:hypothetical protein